jgi:hypothetical protein
MKAIREVEEIPKGCPVPVLVHGDKKDEGGEGEKERKGKERKARQGRSLAVAMGELAFGQIMTSTMATTKFIGVGVDLPQPGLS